MTRRRAGLAVTGVVAACLLAGCSGGDDDPTPGTPSSSAPTTAGTPSVSPRTPPPISPRTTLTLPSSITLPPVVSPPGGSGVPVPTLPPA